MAAVGIRMAYNVSPYRTGFKKLRDVQRVLFEFTSTHVLSSAPDFIQTFARGCCSGKNIVDFVRSVPTDFLDAANKAKFEDLKRFCGASDERCRDILNRAGMKGYADEVFKHVGYCSNETVDPDTGEVIVPAEDLFGDVFNVFTHYSCGDK